MRDPLDMVSRDPVDHIERLLLLMAQRDRHDRRRRRKMNEDFESLKKRTEAFCPQKAAITHGVASESGADRKVDTPNNEESDGD